MIQLYVCTLSFCPLHSFLPVTNLQVGPGQGLRNSSEACGFLPSNFGPKFCFLPASDCPVEGLTSRP